MLCNVKLYFLMEPSRKRDMSGWWNHYEEVYKDWSCGTNRYEEVYEDWTKVGL